MGTSIRKVSLLNWPQKYQNLKKINLHINIKAMGTKIGKVGDLVTTMVMAIINDKTIATEDDSQWIEGLKEGLIKRKNMKFSLEIYHLISLKII